jgi:hypothetical protein
MLICVKVGSGSAAIQLLCCGATVVLAVPLVSALRGLEITFALQLIAMIGHPHIDTMPFQKAPLG